MIKGAIAMNRRPAGSLVVAATLLMAGCAGGGDGPGGAASAGPSSVSTAAASSVSSSSVSSSMVSSGPQSAGPSAGPSAVAPAVSVRRTGGFIGVDEQVTVAADGTWTATAGGGAGRTGRLSDQQRATLNGLAGDPGLAAEAAQTRAPTNCADTFSYTVAVGAARVEYVDCPSDPEPPRIASMIVALIAPAVWG